MCVSSYSNGGCFFTETGNEGKKYLLTVLSFNGNFFFYKGTLFTQVYESVLP